MCTTCVKTFSMKCQNDSSVTFFHRISYSFVLWWIVIKIERIVFDSHQPRNKDTHTHTYNSNKYHHIDTIAYRCQRACARDIGNASCGCVISDVFYAGNNFRRRGEEGGGKRIVKRYIEFIIQAKDARGERVLLHGAATAISREWIFPVRLPPPFLSLLPVVGKWLYSICSFAYIHLDNSPDRKYVAARYFCMSVTWIQTGTESLFLIRVKIMPRTLWRHWYLIFYQICIIEAVRALIRFFVRHCTINN